MQKLELRPWPAICQCLLEIQIHLAFDLVITLLETCFTYTHTYKKKSFYKVIDSGIFNSSKIWKKITSIHQQETDYTVFHLCNKAIEETPSILTEQGLLLNFRKGKMHNNPYNILFFQKEWLGPSCLLTGLDCWVNR